MDDRDRERLYLERQIQDEELQILGLDTALDPLEEQYPELATLPRHGRRKGARDDDPR